MSIGTILEQRPAPAFADGTRLLPHHYFRQHYRNLFALSPADLAAHAQQELVAEMRLPDEQRHEAVYRRLSVWLDLDREEARILAGTYDRAADGLPKELQRRRLEAERDAILNGFSFADFQRLVRLLPWLKGEQGLAIMADAVEAGPAAA